MELHPVSEDTHITEQAELGHLDGHVLPVLLVVLVGQEEGDPVVGAVVPPLTLRVLGQCLVGSEVPEPGGPLGELL